MVTLVPAPAIAPDNNHIPVAGRPFRMTLPVVMNKKKAE